MELDASDIRLERATDRSGVMAIILRGVEIGWVRPTGPHGGYRFDCGAGPLGKAFGTVGETDLPSADAVKRAAAAVVNSNRDFFVGWNQRAAFERSVAAPSDRRKKRRVEPMGIETRTVALPRREDPLGRPEADLAERLRAMAVDAFAGNNREAVEAEADAVARLIGLRRG